MLSFIHSETHEKNCVTFILLLSFNFPGFKLNFYFLNQGNEPCLVFFFLRLYPRLIGALLLGIFHYNVTTHFLELV